MAEFKLGRIRFVWKDAWAAGTTYYKDDVVKAGGRTYICLVGHTANGNFYTDLNFTPARWQQMGDGQSWRGDWTPDTDYFERDIVRYGAILYICDVAHTSVSLELGLEEDIQNWTSYSEGFHWKGNWTAETRYRRNDIVKYGSLTYVANTGHTSAATDAEGLELDQSKWDQYSEGFEWKGLWTTETRYKKNDVVKYGSLTYVCVVHHTSSSDVDSGLELDQANWEKFGEGFEWRGDWAVGTRYVANDLVKYGAITYVCVEGHTSSPTYGEDDSTIDGLEADQSKWEEFTTGFDWKDQWTTGTRYKKNDLVRYGGYTYVANTGHTSATTASDGLELNQALWDQFGEGFEWQGEWAVETRYKKGDLVRYGSTTYVANTGHTSAATLAEGLELDQSKWDNFNQGLDWKGDWDTETRYKKNDLVRYGGIAYVANTGHTSAETIVDGLELDQSKWDVFLEGFEWRNNWTVDTRYRVNDLVRYGGYTYVCNEEHVSAENITDGLEADQNKWTVFNPGIEYLGNWSDDNYRYKINDVVKYGAGLWICIQVHTSTDDSFESQESNWMPFVRGFEFEEQWDVASVYQPGDVVRYGGNQYISKTNHVGTVPTEEDNTDWSLFTEGFNFESDWTVSTSYRIGDVVRVNGSSYLAVKDSPSVSLTITATSDVGNTFTVSSTAGLVPGMIVKFTADTFGEVVENGVYYIKEVVNATTFTVSETVGGVEFDVENGTGSMTAFVGNHPIGSGFWELLSGGISWRNLWSDGVEYDIGNAVRLGDNSYIAVAKHRSAIGNRPDNDNLGNFWNVLSVGSEVSTLTTEGDLVYFSDGGPTRLPIGKEGDVLTVRDGAPEWGIVGYVDHVYYVTPTGINEPAPDHGLSLDQGWGSVRYAAEQILKGPRNANAQRLLEYNRVFIQREITNWIQYQIDNNVGIFDGFSYDAVKCERDVGFVVDRLIWDVGHGGNLKIRAAAQSLLNVLGDGPFSIAEEQEPYNNLTVEGPQSVLAYRYMLDLVNRVLANQAPDVNYQEENSEEDVAEQFIDLTRPAEDTAKDEVAVLMNILITALDTQDPSKIPQRIVANNLIKISTGKFEETLPIIVPAYTCPIGDELRSTTVVAAGSLIDSSDVFYTVNTYNHVDSIVQDIVQGNAVTPTTGNDETQYDAWPAATATEASVVSDLVQVMRLQSDWQTNAMSVATLKDPIDYDGGFAAARKLVFENRQFLAEETLAFLVDEYPELKYSKTLAKRDVKYIVDALIYDLTYGGNALSIQAGLAYYGGEGTGIDQLPASIKVQTIASLEFLKTRLAQVAGDVEITEPLQNVIPQFRDTAGSAGTIELIEDNLDAIIEIITDGPDVVGDTVTLIDPTPADGVNTTTALIAAYDLLAAEIADIATATVAYINTEYPNLEYSEAKAIRDTTLVLKAVGFDFMFDINYQTVKAAHAYLREVSQGLYANSELKTATRASLDFARSQAINNVGGNSDAIARINQLFKLVDTMIFGASNEGSICQTEIEARYHAALQLERNKEFIAKEVEAYIAEEYSEIVSEIVDNKLVISDTSWLRRNVAIKFSGTIFDGLVGDEVYYVQNIISSTEFTIATERNATTPLTLVNEVGTMTMSLSYNKDLCLRDVVTYIDALKYDLRMPGNYQSRYVARYYANAVNGSKEEDMFYLRDGTGVRNMTLNGLFGDLTPPNSVGTSRTTAGAYCSLDPGWGPDDFTTWIIDRSPYVQNVTTFGHAAIGQKIDGALHNGGNDSIVSNDFTQVISDGIGAWVDNNGRAELVSVFTYYSHIGYLSTNGGRIRGTNGNNSYGDFGSVAEGFDETEVPNTASVDNRLQFKATVDNVFTNGSALLAFEFENAGSEYTEATWVLTGGGFGAEVKQDEFRDGGVFQVRILPSEEGDLGGEGYLTNSNTAQTGTLTSITIAAVDSEVDSAYVGMKLIITGGPGQGQFAIIDSYNSATKIAELIRETDGNPGWDHFVPGTPILTPTGNSTYTIQPAVSFTAPSYSTELTSLTSSLAWNSVKYAETYRTYIVTGSTSGTGQDAEFQITRKGNKYQRVQIRIAGTGYARLDTVVISGSDLGGTSNNDLTIIVTSIGNLGEILAFDFNGYGSGGNFVAVATTDLVNTAADGADWVARPAALPSSGTWLLASGQLFKEFTFGEFVIGDSYTIVELGEPAFWFQVGALEGQNQPGDIFVATDSGSSGSGTARLNTNVLVAVDQDDTTSAYSRDGGITWSQGGILPFIPQAINYGNGRWIAIENGISTTYSDDGGITWLDGGFLPNDTNWTSIVYGKGVWVAVASGGTIAASSSNGGVSWVSRTLPSSNNWVSVAYGNNRFVAVSNNGNTVAAFSLDGINWSSSTMPASASWTAITYGQGVFFAVSTSSQAATSEDGIAWISRTINAPGSGHKAITFGNPNQSGSFVAVGAGTGVSAAKAKSGARARARAFVADQTIFSILITEPGSGYETAPTMTISDSNVIVPLIATVRTGNSVLANPSFLSRGSQFITGSATLDIGDGFADTFQTGSFVAVRRLTQEPIAGSNLVFSHLPDRTFKVVNVVSRAGELDGSYTASFQISPQLSAADAPGDGVTLTTRIRFSQVRLTGHDFLDIGTGNFVKTNYPGLPLVPANPGKETNELGGGRVFYTSTDQDGNFRVGELFSIEQATGIATLNADAFNVAGLQELNLGTVTLGGGSATVTEFSTDPFFTADSDNLVPTQRAVKAYIASQIGGGGASLNVNTVTAGSVFISGSEITTVTGETIIMNATFEFKGGIKGYPLAFNYFLT